MSLTLWGRIQLIPAIEMNIFQRAAATGRCRNNWFTDSRLLRRMKHLYTSWSFPLIRLSRARVSFLRRVLDVKDLILEGSLVFQIGFPGHWSIMSFEEHKLWYPSLTVYFPVSELLYFKLSGKWGDIEAPSRGLKKSYSSLSSQCWKFLLKRGTHIPSSLFEPLSSQNLIELWWPILKDTSWKNSSLSLLTYFQGPTP